jgi:hypothetical protein
MKGLAIQTRAMVHHRQDAGFTGMPNEIENYGDSWNFSVSSLEQGLNAFESQAPIQSANATVGGTDADSHSWRKNILVLGMFLLNID